MKKILISMFIACILLFSVVSASMVLPLSDKAKEHAKGAEHSPVIGEGWDLERVDFIHYAKPDGVGGGKDKNKPKPGDSTDSCYSLMGVKWKGLPVSYAVNPLNPSGLSEAFVMNTFVESAETWDNAISGELFSNTILVDYSAVYGVRDYQNSVVFGDHDNSNVIGVTSVWYTRKGKQIVEFDMLFNTDFAWGDATLDPSVMDFQNIATHELGHAVGLADLYTTECQTVTMYGYSGYGDTSKRALESSDVSGLQRMYGL